MPFTISCPKCGKTAAIPDDAIGKRAGCPACGQQFRVGAPLPIARPVAAVENPATPKKSKRMVLVAVGAVAFVALSLIALAVVVLDSGSGKTESATAEPAAGSVMVTGDFWKDYGDNALKADQTYKGKWMEFSGRGKIQIDAKGNYVFGIPMVEAAGVSTAVYRTMGVQEKKWYNEGYPPQILCTIAAKDQKGFAALGPMDTAILVGRCQGMRKEPDVPHGYVVLFDECRLKEIHPFR